MSAHRWPVVLLLITAKAACVANHSSDDSSVLDQTVHGDLPFARSLDILVVAPFGQSASWSREGLAMVAYRLQESLLVTNRLSPDAIRLGVVSTSIEGKSLCQSTPPPAGALISVPGNPKILTAETPPDGWWSQIVSAQSPECHNPNFLEAAALAIDGRNEGFPQNDAVLVVLLLMNMDDCSVADLSVWDDPDAWGSEKLSTTTRCYLPANGFLYGVERYPSLLLDNFAGRILVAAIAWPTEPSFFSDQGYLVVEDKCQGRIYPAPRTVQFVEAVESLANPRLKGAIYDIGCEAMGGNPPVASLVSAIIEHGDF